METAVSVAAAPSVHLFRAGRDDGSTLRVSYLKRFLDTLLVLVILPLIAPLMLFLAIWVKLVSRGPVFFVQPRVGLGGKVFRCYKFRTMHCDGRRKSRHSDYMARIVRANLPMTKMESGTGNCLIPLGGVIRAMGLDELPQLFNIIKGEMSLVGPRPCTTYELQFYDASRQERFSVLPGLTGLWQVSGKNKMSFSAMVDLDMAYARCWSIWLDLRILLDTPMVLMDQVREARAA